MPRFHISQDETGFWQLSFEDDAGNLQLVSHQFPGPEHLIDDAHELVATKYPDAIVVVAPPRRAAPTEAAAAAAAAPRPYRRPAPRKADE